MSYLNKLKLFFVALFLLLTTNSFSIDIPSTEKVTPDTMYRLPKKLIGTYEGTLTKLSGRAIVNPEGTCTIKKTSTNSYSLKFSNGLGSIRNVRFKQDEDVFTATGLYKGKKLGISLDLDGSLSVGSLSGTKVLAFNGDLINTRGDSYDDDDSIHNGNQHIRTNGNGTTIRNGNQKIKTRGGNTRIKNGNQSINTKGNGTRIKNGNQSINTRNNGSVSIKTGGLGIDASNGNVSIRTGNGSIEVNNNEDDDYEDTSSVHINDNHKYRGNAFYECNSNEVSNLPEQVIGLYMGELKAPGVYTKKGICKIVKTGCKTYRMDFSNGIPSIYGVQFGRENNFKEFTSVIIDGEYATDIEIDMRFDDLTIEKGMFNIAFDGEKQ